MKKVLSIFLSLLIAGSVSTAVPFVANGADAPAYKTGETSGNYTYELLEDGTAEITAYTSIEEQLEVPSALPGNLSEMHIARSA